MTASLPVVLFDLDGTLIDSAPDLAGAANDMRVERGLEPLAYERLRPMVGSGARGMIGVAFSVGPEHTDFPALRDEFLDRYERRMAQDTCVFTDVLPLLAELEASGHRWGIVTNKAMRFTAPLVQALGLAERAAVVIAGDTTAHAKPHPAPLLEAASRLQIDPHRCLYVGDDHRDVLAGRAAGMTTVAVTWGYLGLGEPVNRWGAHHIANTPNEILNWLAMA